MISDNGEFIVHSKECDTNQLICFYGYNEYGFSENSDTILINDLIEDPEILNDLNQFTGIVLTNSDANITDLLDFCIDEMIVKSNLINEVVVCNSLGHIVCELHNTHEGDRIRIKKGFYLVKMKMGNKYLTKKIIL